LEKDALVVQRSEITIELSNVLKRMMRHFSEENLIANILESTVSGIIFLLVAEVSFFQIMKRFQ
jgi:hypothetical protein